MSQQEEQNRTETHAIIGPGQWGSGKTVLEAKAVFRKHGGLLRDGYLHVVFDADTEFTGVDDLGRYHWRSLDGEAPNGPVSETVIHGRRTNRA